jgi:hypothetical protein
MKRVNFVRNQIPKRTFVDVAKILKPGSVWTTREKFDSNIFIRIKKLVGADNTGKCIFGVETTQHPKWWTLRGRWNKSDWAVEESFVRYEFHKKYKRVYFVEPFNIQTGFESHNLGRSWYFAMSMFCVMALVLDLITKIYWTGLFMLVCLGFNLYQFRQKSKAHE